MIIVRGKGVSETEQEAQEGGGGGITRRDFIIGGLASGLLLLLPDTAYGRQSQKGPPEETSKWLFLDEASYEAKKRQLERPVDLKSKNMVQIGPELDMPEYISLYSVVRHGVEGEMSRRGLSPRNYGVWVAYRSYGFADAPSVSQSVADYAGSAVDFMHSKIRGLDPKCAGITWVPLRPGEDYSRDFNGKGFVGMGQYTHARGGFMNKSDRKITEIARANSLDMSAQFRLFDYDSDKDGEIDWYIFLSTNYTSLMSPFSEVLHMAVYKRALKYQSEAGPGAEALASEAFAEASAEVLGGMMVDRFGIPGGHKVIARAGAERKKSPKYKLIGQAVPWIERYGPQAAYDLYMDSPGKFVKTIQSYPR